MTNPLESFYLNWDEPNCGCLLALRDIILAQDSNITERLNYGSPCFSFKNKIFCYLWVDKKTKEPYILVVEGNRLDNPFLEAGNRKRMKIFRVNPNEDLPVSTIEIILKEALDLYRSGIIKTN